MCKGLISKICYYTLIGLSVLNLSSVFAQALSLKQAEALALQHSTEIESFRAKNESLYQAAIAAGQLPDPRLMISTLNIPVDTFKFNQEPMTQIQLGLGQHFPRGKSLFYNRQEKAQLSEVELYKLQMISLSILQKVRLSWLQLYYWQHAKEIVLQQKKIFGDLLQVAQSMLANNKSQQKDVIRAQLELTELKNRLLGIEQQVQTAQFQLARWISETKATKAETFNEPDWPLLPEKNELSNEIKKHPELKADSAIISARRIAVKLALEQYKPEFNVNVGYGFRQGSGIDGKKRPDFLSAIVNMDLPVFTRNRQDRALTASEKILLASEKDRQSHYQNLQETLNIQYVAWQQKQKSFNLYTSLLIPQAIQYAQATMTAYQNFQTDFPTLARAYVRQLDTELEGLKVRVERDAARIDLLYLQGK